MTDMTTLVKRIYANPEQQSHFAESIAAARDGDAVARIRADALREAAEICTSIIRDYDVMKPDGKTYEPLKVQKAAKGMVSLARQDILALIHKEASHDRT